MQAGKVPVDDRSASVIKYRKTYMNKNVNMQCQKMENNVS